MVQKQNTRNAYLRTDDKWCTFTIRQPHRLFNLILYKRALHEVWLHSMNYCRSIRRAERTIYLRKCSRRISRRLDGRLVRVGRQLSEGFSRIYLPRYLPPSAGAARESVGPLWQPLTSHRHSGQACRTNARRYSATSTLASTYSDADVACQRRIDFHTQ